MMNANDIRTGRHCVFNLHVHLVFVTKYRKGVFSKEMLEEMKNIFSKVCNDFEVELAEFDGEKNHVHLLINYPPKVQLSKLVNSLKGVSSRKLRKNFPELSKSYWRGVLWSPSYFAGSCGGAPVSIIKQYIEQQNTPG
ncbi:MAG: IS200/IS605 family transposase [Firmicutes bacterium]|nr:IS200/IS605 family transposase [Bacillota bacterium]